MSIFNTFQLSYWFAVYTPPLRVFSLVAALVVVGLFLGAGIALRLQSKKRKENPPLSRGLARLARPFWFFAVFVFLLVGFRQLGAVILSARGWLLLILGITVVWFVTILQGVRRSYKQEYARLLERKKYEEYLPKKRK